MIDGVMSFEPSQSTPPNGCRNVAAPIADRVVAGLRGRSNANAPSAPRRGRGDLVAARVGELHGDAGEPDLAVLDLAGRAAARLEVAPDDAGDAALDAACGSTACAAVGHVARRDARQPELRHVTGLQRRSCRV